MPTAFPSVQVTPVVHPASSKVDFGAVVTGVDLNDLSNEEFGEIEEALYRHKVLIIKDQENLDSHKQFDFVVRFDQVDAPERGHGESAQTYNGHKSLLNGIGNAVEGLHPEMMLIGGGPQAARFQGKKLTQADHTMYHKFPLTSEQREQGLTRWHRWHMDCSVFKTSLPLVTSLLAVEVPQGPELTVQWDDGSNQTMKVMAGTTAFISGAKMYELLSPEDKLLADNSRVQYAPWPYTWNGAGKGNSNGLGTYHEGLELPVEDLPPWSEEDLKTYPMVWTNPKTGERSFQVHSVVVWKIFLKTSPTAPEVLMSDVSEIRKLLYRLQRPAIDKEHVFAPPYSKGDLALFYNRGVYHTATDYPESYGTRSMLQAHIAASSDPI